MSLQSLAVVSVQDRGFYDLRAIPDLARNPLLSAQVLRFAEEVGELCRAADYSADLPSVLSECADVAIVAYQIAHLTGQNVSEVRIPSPYTDASILPALSLLVASAGGELCRALRKNDLLAVSEWLAHLWRALDRVALACGGDLEEGIRQKLLADEGRGYLHGAAAVGGDRALNHHIWQSEEPGQYSHNGGALGVDDGPASLNEVSNEHTIYNDRMEPLTLWKERIVLL